MMFGNTVYIPMNPSDLNLMVKTVDLRIHDLNTLEITQRLTEEQMNERYELLNLKKKFEILKNEELN